MVHGDLPGTGNMIDCSDIGMRSDYSNDSRKRDENSKCDYEKSEG